MILSFHLPPIASARGLCEIDRVQIRGAKYDQVVLSRMVYEVVFNTTNTNTSTNNMERIRVDTRSDPVVFFPVVWIRGRIDTRSYGLVFLYKYNTNTTFFYQIRPRIRTRICNDEKRIVIIIRSVIRNKTGDFGLFFHMQLSIFDMHVPITHSERHLNPQFRHFDVKKMNENDVTWRPNSGFPLNRSC